MFDARPGWPPTPGFLRLYVCDADAVHRQAVAAGGTSVTEVTHLFFGDRVGRVGDPLGNLWRSQARQHWAIDNRQHYVREVCPRRA